jgi:hypothetical protein
MVSVALQTISIGVYLGLFVCRKFFFYKVNFRKVNYFLIFGNVMKNKLKNNF